MIRKKMNAGLLAALLLGASVPFALAQSQPPSIEDMTANDILKAMQIDGRVAMAGTFFESDSAKLTAEAETVLSKLAESLEQMPDARVAVVGHSDSTGDFAYNVDLSAMRAQNVIEALVSNHGVRRARLVGLGAGPIDPAASNATPEGRAQNRRVAFVVIDETEADPEQSEEASQSVSADQPATGVWMSDAVTGCAIWSAEEPGDSEKASWSGACDAGQASGRGTLLFWDEQGVIARYQGEMKGGRLDGSGFLAFREEDGTDYYTYSGKFRFGETVGEGVLISPSGYRFEGELLGGIDHGKGKLITPDGWKVEGEIKDGKLVGEGLALYEDETKDLYFGDVENGKRHGFGTLLMHTDDAYFGQFVEGAPEGPGVFEGVDGSTYLGIFANGQPNGMGTVIDGEGTSYQGRFIDGGADGQILVTTKDGAQSIEIWKDGEKIQ